MESVKKHINGGEHSGFNAVALGWPSVPEGRTELTNWNNIIIIPTKSIAKA